MTPLSSFGINRRVLIAFVAALAFQPQAATAQQTKPSYTFSFAVYGDSRSMMYLPYKTDQRGGSAQADGGHV